MLSLCQPSLHGYLKMATLRNVLRANATSCLAFGGLFLLMPAPAAGFLGTENLAPNIVFQLLGVVLVFNGFHLVWASLQASPPKLLVLYFSAGDFLWVAGTALLLVMGLWITSPVGIISSLLIAAWVGTLGVLQLVSYKKLGPVTQADDFS